MTKNEIDAIANEAAAMMRNAANLSENAASRDMTTAGIAVCGAPSKKE